jgi:hypothetical protein
MGGDEHVNAVSVGFARTPTRHALTENNANDINAPSSAAKLASFKGRYVGRGRTPDPNARDCRRTPADVLATLFSLSNFPDCFALPKSLFYFFL